MAASAAYVRDQGKTLDFLKQNKGQEFTVAQLAQELGIKGRRTVHVTAATRGFSGDPECPVQRVVRSGEPKFRYNASKPRPRDTVIPAEVETEETPAQVISADLHLVVPPKGMHVFADAEGKVWYAQPFSG